MEGNEVLSRVLTDAGLTQGELAEAVNSYLRAKGYEGTVSDRTVRFWLTGKTRWPHPRQREALTAVFGVDAAELGFVPPAARRSPTTEPEQPVLRRTFFSAATATTAAAVAPFTTRSRVGITDIARLRSGLDGLVALDDTGGGHEALEQDALSRAGQALEMQELASSQRIRQRLFSVAADYTARAAWAALDARQLARAQPLLGRALYLAGMAQDSMVEMEVWNLYAMLARQSQDYGHAVTSGHAALATSIARRDPLFASLAHARTAVGHSLLSDRQAALRSLGYAEEALGKSDPTVRRPSWLAFYGPAELSAMTAIVLDRIGDSLEAEAASHQALSNIPEQFRRNRALATARLALAQLHQRDIQLACDTAESVFTMMSGTSIPGRMRSLLGDFYRDLITLAPKSNTTQEWGERFRLEWSRA
ncbi:helix-turn-helix domain-containing protein [Streptomyces polygonati]|uniref:Helix-turn-helix domain-containing protein n=1 Tax=Streptomyces polygonati TaxID=1617087 RepID=A0ABV8HWN5_9ACTN